MDEMRSSAFRPFATQTPNAKSSFFGERIPIELEDVYRRRWPSNPLLKLVGATTPELIILPRNWAAAAALCLQTVYDLAAKWRVGLRFNCKI
jgi:hypothetical protein